MSKTKTTKRKNRVAINVLIDAGQAKSIQAIADASQCSFSAAVRRLLSIAMGKKVLR